MNNKNSAFYIQGDENMLQYGLKAAGSRQQAAGSRQQAAGSRQQAAGSRQQAAGSRQQWNLDNNLRKNVLTGHVCDRQHHFNTSKLINTNNSQLHNHHKLQFYSRILDYIVVLQRNLNIIFDCLDGASIHYVYCVCRRLHVSTLIPILLFGLFCTNLAHGVLSAKTAKTIQGHKPYLKFNGVAVTNSDELLSFTIPNGSSGTTTIEPTITTSINADKSWTFNQFVTKVVADGTTKNLSAVAGVTYADNDNDTPHKTSSVVGTLTATWSYVVPTFGGGTEVKKLSSSDLSGKLDACNGPYTLTITANGVKAQSAYGHPINNIYSNKSKAYTVNVNDYKFCFARPNQIVAKPDNIWVGQSSSGSQTSWNDVANTTPNAQNGGGYNSSFDPVRGFKADATTKFPTTGFVGGQFRLLMSHNQSDYTYSSSQPTKVSVSTTGEVLFLSKPSGAVTITATPKAAIAPGFPAVTYTFNPTNVWAVPNQTLMTYSTSLCGGVAYQLTRAQLTNSPRNTAPIGWSSIPNSYTRSVGGGVFNEWGFSDATSYPSSKWVSNIYWTKDVRTTGSQQFYVNSYSGGVGFIHFNSTISVVCKG